MLFYDEPRLTRVVCALLIVLLAPLVADPQVGFAKDVVDGQVHDYGRPGDDPVTADFDESTLVASAIHVANSRYHESTKFGLTVNGTPVSLYRYQKGTRRSGFYNFDVSRFSSADRTPQFRITVEDDTKIESVEIHPECCYPQSAFQVSSDKRSLTFAMSERLPYCIVVINGSVTDEQLANPMLAIINDPPETFKPDLSSKNVLNFKEFSANYLQAHPIRDRVGDVCRPAGTVTDKSRNTSEEFSWKYDAGRFAARTAARVQFPDLRVRHPNDVSDTFQAAIREVRDSPNLDTIYFPAGTYIWSGLVIQNWDGNGADGKLNIYLDEDALLVNRLQECREAMEPAIGIWNSSNITISGRGIFDGNGCYNVEMDGKEARETPHQGGAMVVHSANITFNDIYVRDVKQWNWECHTAKRIAYNNIKGLSPYAHAWVDGLDLTSGQHIIVNGAFTLGNDDTFASGHYNPSDEFPRRFLDELDQAEGETKSRMEARMRHVCAAAAIYNRDRLKWDTADSQDIIVKNTLGWSGIANSVRLGHNTRWKGVPGKYESYQLKSYEFENFHSVLRRGGTGVRVQNGNFRSHPRYESLVFRDCSFMGNRAENVAIPAGSDLARFNPSKVVMDTCSFSDSAGPFIFRRISNLVLRDLLISGKPLTDPGQTAMAFDEIGTLTFHSNGREVGELFLREHEDRDSQ